MLLSFILLILGIAVAFWPGYILSRFYWHREPKYRKYGLLCLGAGILFAIIGGSGFVEILR